MAQSFRKKDIYVPESISSDEDVNDRVQFTPGKPPVHITKSCSENDLAGVDEEHLYEAPDVLEDMRKKKKQSKLKKDIPVPPSKPLGISLNGKGNSPGGVSNGSVGNDDSHDLGEYENLPTLKEVENEEPDKPPPPPLPPAPHSRNHPVPHSRHNNPAPAPSVSVQPPPPPSYPPPSDESNSSAPDVPAHYPKPTKKALPTPPPKHKIPTTNKPQPPPGHKPTRIKSTPPTPPHTAADTMAQLSTALMNRSVGGGGAPPPPPKGKSRKPVGGMRYI